MTYLYLALAMSEIVATTFLKLSDGFQAVADIRDGAGDAVAF